MRVGFIVLLQVLPLLVHSRFSKFEAVPAPQHAPMRLMDAIAEDGSVVYNDEASRLTSVKDNNFKACFITDLDPEWNLDINEKQELVDTREPEIVRSPLQYENLKIRTGDMIAMMCKKSKIYWLTETHSQPLQSSSSRMALSGEVAMPPPVHHPVAPAHVVPHAQPQPPHRMPQPVQGSPAKIPMHFQEPVQQQAPAHIGVPQLVPAHTGLSPHAPAQQTHQQHVPPPQLVPARVPASAAFTAPGRAQVPAPQHVPQQIPGHAAFHAPAPVAVQPHIPQVMLVPRHLPYIRPPVPASAGGGKPRTSQQSDDQPMAVPQRLSMARPQLQPHH